MHLTTKQVAEKLKIHTSTVRKLVQSGLLPAANRSTNGRRVNYLFDPNALRLYQQSLPQSLPRQRSAPRQRTTPPAPVPAPAVVVARLERIEALLQKLAQLWS